jgi:hypothetical protein
MLPFELIGLVEEIETIATGNPIRELSRLRKVYGLGRWGKLKGFAAIRFQVVRLFRQKFIGTRQLVLVAKSTR